MEDLHYKFIKNNEKISACGDHASVLPDSGVSVLDILQGWVCPVHSSGAASGECSIMGYNTAANAAADFEHDAAKHWDGRSAQIFHDKHLACCYSDCSVLIDSFFIHHVIYTNIHFFYRCCRS